MKDLLDPTLDCEEDSGLSNVSEQLDQIITHIEVIRTNLINANDFLKLIKKMHLMDPDELRELDLFTSTKRDSEQTPPDDHR